MAPAAVITPGLREHMAAASGGNVAAVIARAVLFCASDLASSVTGSTVLVDGGAMTL